MLSKEAIEEFKRIYKKEFKEELTDGEAYKRATKLLSLYGTVYGSKTKKHGREIKNR
ncbi:MAG: hypothetical protein Q8O13_00385 [Candidatus Omnitrophota bacterium]|nr:hypothetical protein [Candidatus Omnitrophota bacterium]